MQPSELIIRPDGSIYHLHLCPGDISPAVIFVGDPARVDRVAQRFESIRLKRRNREFYTVTGTFKGAEISVISTGIGTDNIDIVWNELDALFNIDFSTRKPHSKLTPMQVLRLGTCGGMRPEIPLGTLALSSYALGGDGLMPYYEVSSSPDFDTAWKAFKQEKLAPELPIYTAAADESLLRLVASSFPHVHRGITFTAAGFYGPQGRSLGRIPVRWPDLPARIAEFAFGPDRVLNMEMETSAILALGKALGHKAGSLSVILANRQAGGFHPDPGAAVDILIDQGLAIMSRWLKEKPI